MASLVKIKKTKDTAGKQVQHVLYEQGGSFQVHRWEEATDTNRVVEELPYEGHADRKAARAMALGALHSLHQQALYETHGDRYTDKHGTTLYWAASKGGYVAISEDCE